MIRLDISQNELHTLLEALETRKKYLEERKESGVDVSFSLPQCERLYERLCELE